jgi:beta-phosphoglucomutase-like phosphatase (HAD superfamily)
MKQYSTYIFDLDGTITNTMAVWIGILRDELIHFGIPSPDDKTLIQHSHDWREMVKVGLPEKFLPEFTELMYKLANERLPEASFHEGAYEMLSSLKEQGKRIAIFSTMDRPIFEPAMQHQDLYQFAEVAVAGTDVPRRKPHPDGILKALADLGIPEEDYSRAVYLGDKDTDIQAAHNAGIASMLYYPPVHQEMYSLDELKKHNPKHILTDWRELL